jgi:hypothetical protein
MCAHSGLSFCLIPFPPRLKGSGGRLTDAKVKITRVRQLYQRMVLNLKVNRVRGGRVVATIMWYFLFANKGLHNAVWLVIEFL